MSTATETTRLDFTRTERAIAEYDVLDNRFHADPTPKALALVEAAGEAVGVAFGLDTIDRNNPDDCRKLIRPGPRVPAAGYEESFVRRTVRNWIESAAALAPAQEAK